MKSFGKSAIWFDEGVAHPLFKYHIGTGYQRDKALDISVVSYFRMSS